MEVSEAIWDKLKNTIIEKVLLSVGLSSLNPMGKVVIFFAGKFLDKFVKPQYHIGVAHGIEHWTETVGKKKLKELDDAISNQDRDTAIDVIDSM